MIRVLPGDCLAVLATLPADSVDAVVTDPPYGLEFMRLGSMLPGGGGMGDMDFSDRRSLPYERGADRKVRPSRVGDWSDALPS